MSKQLEILSQVMLSLKSKQTKVMHNINVLLSNNSTSSELNLFDKIEFELGELSVVHAKMQECESFMLQFAQHALKNNVDNKKDDDSRIGSGGNVDEGLETSEK